MAGQPESIILEHLRRIRGTVERTAEDVHDLKQRMTSVEYQIAQLRLDVAGQSVRMDRMDSRLERIERRLDLVDPAVPPGL